MQINQILMNKFRANVVSSKTQFKQGEKAKVFLKDAFSVKLDYGKRLPEFKKQRARHTKMACSYPYWTVEVDKLPKILRFVPFTIYEFFNVNKDLKKCFFVTHSKVIFNTKCLNWNFLIW